MARPPPTISCCHSDSSCIWSSTSLTLSCPSDIHSPGFPIIETPGSAVSKFSTKACIIMYLAISPPAHVANTMSFCCNHHFRQPTKHYHQGLLQYGVDNNHHEHYCCYYDSNQWSLKHATKPSRLTENPTAIATNFTSKFLEFKRFLANVKRWIGGVLTYEVAIASNSASNQISSSLIPAGL